MNLMRVSQYYLLCHEPFRSDSERLFPQVTPAATPCPIAVPSDQLMTGIFFWVSRSGRRGKTDSVVHAEVSGSLTLSILPGHFGARQPGEIPETRPQA